MQKRLFEKGYPTTEHIPWVRWFRLLSYSLCIYCSKQIQPKLYYQVILGSVTNYLIPGKAVLAHPYGPFVASSVVDRDHYWCCGREYASARASCARALSRGRLVKVVSDKQAPYGRHYTSIPSNVSGMRWPIVCQWKGVKYPYFDFDVRLWLAPAFITQRSKFSV